MFAQLPLNIFSNGAAEKRDLAMSIIKNNEYRNGVGRKDYSIGWPGTPGGEDVRTAIEQELQREWELELEQEVVAEHQRVEELLQVLYVTSRMLLNFISKEEQGGPG